MEGEADRIITLAGHRAGPTLAGGRRATRTLAGSATYTPGVVEFSALLTEAGDELTTEAGDTLILEAA